ncbi:MAG: hypothetical protein WC867_02860 [Candidatus Pacearchaeota archaeon]|jgi:hypothetical protein
MKKYNLNRDSGNSELPPLEEMSKIDVFNYVRNTPGDTSTHLAIAKYVIATYSTRDVGSLIDMSRLEGMVHQPFFQELIKVIE